MVRTFLKVYMELGSLFFVSARTNKRHHHHLGDVVKDAELGEAMDSGVEAAVRMRPILAIMWL